MSTKEDKPYPDTWHVITFDNNHRSNKHKLAIKDSNAKYYILEKYSCHSLSSSGNRYDFNEFEVYDSNFKLISLEINGVRLMDFTTEIWDRQGVGTSKVGFTIKDRVG